MKYRLERRGTLSLLSNEIISLIKWMIVIVGKDAPNTVLGTYLILLYEYEFKVLWSFFNISSATKF